MGSLTHSHTHKHTPTYTHSACLFRYILPDFASKPVVVMWLPLNLCETEKKRERKKKRRFQTASVTGSSTNVRLHCFVRLSERMKRYRGSGHSHERESHVN